MVWFGERAPAAVSDFFEVCVRAVPDDPGLRAAAGGDWARLATQLHDAGAQLAREGREFATWGEHANLTFAMIAPRLVEAFAAEPARLAETLLVLGEYMEHSLATGARAYSATKQHLHGHRSPESLALWAHALDQAVFGVVITDVASNMVTWVNAAYARMLGHTPDELIGIDGRKLLARTTNVRALDVRERGPDVNAMTFWVDLRRKDGTTIPVLISTSIVEAETGPPVRVSTVLDNTQLAASTSRLEILARTAHELAAANGDVSELIELVARRLAESIGESCTVRMLAEDGQSTDHRAAFFHVDPEICAKARAALGAGPHPLGSGIARQVVESGTPIMVASIDPEVVVAQAPEPFRAMLALFQVSSVLAVPIKARGRMLGVASLLRSSSAPPYTLDDQRFAQDLADRAGLAIDNAELLATLEERVAERTRALEGSNRELESFSYSVSHDLRAPLRAIDSFSALLEEDHGDALGADGRHLIERVRSNAQRMGSLIEGLLVLSGVTRAKMIRERVDLSAMATEILHELARVEPDRRVTTHVTPGIIVHADARLVHILLENLIGNAWKFSAKRDVAEIWIGGDSTTFHVRDNGAGFDMRYADDLFLPFHRLHHADEFAGTGVGLATVHRIVCHHGGTIHAESAPEQGATFFVSLVATG